MRICSHYTKALFQVPYIYNKKISQWLVHEPGRGNIYRDCISALHKNFVLCRIHKKHYPMSSKRPWYDKYLRIYSHHPKAHLPMASIRPGSARNIYRANIFTLYNIFILSRI